MRTARPLLLALLLLLLLSQFTAVLFAHAEFESATPAPGSVVSNPIGSIRVVFSEPIGPESQIVVFNSQFQTIPNLTSQVDPDQPHHLIGNISQEVATGTYTLQWTAVSVDGHLISGSYNFRVATVPFAINPQQLLLVGLTLAVLLFFTQRWRKANRPQPIGFP